MAAEMIFPDIFTNPDFEYPAGTQQPNAAVADGLSGWACCLTGSDTPKNFGKGMCKIAAITGESSGPDSLNRQADKLLN